MFIASLRSGVRMSQSGHDREPDRWYRFVRRYGLLASAGGVALLVLQGRHALPTPIHVALNVVGIIYIVAAAIAVIGFVITRPRRNDET